MKFRRTGNSSWFLVRLPPCLSLQHAEYRFLSSLNVLNVVQSAIMFCGISAGVLACTAGVAKVRPLTGELGAQGAWAC